MKKKSSPIHKKTSHVVKGNGKETDMAEVKASRLIPLSDDEFKDF